MPFKFCYWILQNENERVRSESCYWYSSGHWRVEEAVEVVIVAGSRGIWPGTVHKVAVAVEVVEGMAVEAAVEEVEEGVTTVAVLAILPGSVLIVDVDFRVWSGNSKKET